MASKKITDLDPLSTKPSDTDFLVVVDVANNKTKKLQVNKAMEAAPVQSVNGADGVVTFDYVESINGKKGPLAKLNKADITGLDTEIVAIWAAIGSGGGVNPKHPPEAKAEVQEAGPYYYGATITLDGSNSDPNPVDPSNGNSIISYTWKTGDGSTSTGTTTTHTLPTGNLGDTGTSYSINLVVIDDEAGFNEKDGNTIFINIEPAPLEPSNSESANQLFVTSTGALLLRAPQFTQITTVFNAGGGDEVETYYT